MEQQGMVKKGIWYLSLALCLLITLAGAYKTLLISADIDEAYALILAQRLAGGDRLLLEMWEPHQLSALLYVLPVFVYQLLVDSAGKGILLFLRALGLLVQLLMAIWLYRELSGGRRSGSSLWIAFLYLNFTPKLIQSPEFNILFYWAMTAMLLLLRRQNIRSKAPEQGKLSIPESICLGLCMCVMVLCYPTAVLVFVYVLLLQLFRKDHRAALWFGGTCLLAAALLLLGMALAGDFSAALSNVGNVLSDSSHDQGIGARWLWHGQTLIRLFMVTAALLVLCLVGKPVLDRKSTADGWFEGAFLLLQAGWMLYRFHSWQGKVYYDYLSVVGELFLAGYVLLRGYRKQEESSGESSGENSGKGLLALTLLSLASVMTLSNLAANYSMGMLMPYLLIVILPALTAKISFAAEPKSRGRLFCRVTALLLAVVFTLQICVIRCVLVRFSGNQRRNVFETYYQVNHGPIAGIRLSGDDWKHYDDLLHAYALGVRKEDKVLFVGASMFFYSLLKPEQIAMGNTISSPVYDRQILSYYEELPDRLPTLLVLDGGYVADYTEFMRMEPFASFVRERFDLTKGEVYGSVVIYHLKEKE